MRGMSSLRRCVRTLLVLACFWHFWLGGVILAWTYAPATWLLERDELKRRRRVQRLLRKCFGVFHGVMRAMGLVELRAAPALASLLPRPRMFVANHPTLVDVTAILSALDDVCCVIKPSLMRSPFIGPLLRVAGHIDGGRGDAASGAAALKASVDRLHDGFSVLIFPEGTRSPLRGLHPFKRGAFELAARGQVEVQPIVVRCDPPALGKGVPVWAHPLDIAVLTLDVGEPVDASAWTGKTRALRALVESKYRESLGLPASTPAVMQRSAEHGMNDQWVSQR